MGYTALRSRAVSQLTTPEVKFLGLNLRLERMGQTSPEGEARGTSLAYSQEPQVQTKELYRGCCKLDTALLHRAVYQTIIYHHFQEL